MIRDYLLLGVGFVSGACAVLGVFIARGHIEERARRDYFRDVDAIARRRRVGAA